MKNFINHFASRARKAVSALEYAILLGVIAVGVGLAVNVIGTDVTAQITSGGDAVNTSGGVIKRNYANPM